MFCCHAYKTKGKSMFFLQKHNFFAKYNDFRMCVTKILGAGEALRGTSQAPRGTLSTGLG